ncbi:MAG: hypothetical protein ABGY43_01030 [bacterium]
MRLTQADASFNYMESASGPMHISSVYVLDGELDFKKFMTRFEKRIYLVPAYNDISQRTRCFINWSRNTGLSSKICCRGRAGIYQLTLPENSRIT